MLKKELFLEVLNLIQEQDKINAEVSTALEKVSGGWVRFDSENKLNIVVDILLKEVCHDDYGYISWYLNEHLEPQKRIIKDSARNKQWVVDTPEKLYDFLVEDWEYRQVQNENNEK